MAIYNITGLQTADSITDIIVWNNTVTSQVFVSSFMISLFFIFFLIFKKNNDFEESVLASSFACFVLSLFLRQMNLINFNLVLLFLGILATMAFFVFKDNNPFR